MNSIKHYPAPWSTSLKVISSVVTIVCIGVAVGLIAGRQGSTRSLALVPLALICGAALFTIRGYTVTPEQILVHRLFWTTPLPLTGLESAAVQPDAMRLSIRLLGNGGLFSFTGIFRNKVLGNYRAFVTHPHHAVVLRYAGRTVVVSPAAAEEFVNQLAVSSRAA